MTDQLLKLYNTPCSPENGCNCFLHSFTVPDRCDQSDDFSALKPFSDFLQQTNVDNNAYDLQTVMNCARTYVHPSLTFDHANFPQDDARLSMNTITYGIRSLGLF
jgi:hypothetical protein